VIDEVRGGDGRRGDEAVEGRGSFEGDEGDSGIRVRSGGVLAGAILSFECGRRCDNGNP